MRQNEKVEAVQRLGMIVLHIGIPGAVDWAEGDRNMMQVQASIVEMDIE